MKRRDFVSRVVLGGAAACTSLPGSAFAAPSSSGPFSFRFVGMMGFIERQDRSFLVATPGQSHHMNHVPFLMARAGSPVAEALGFVRVPNVVPEAFDTSLIGTKPGDFVYKSLNNVALDVVSGQDDRVVNQATEMAHMSEIAPGKRIKGNLEKWASSTVSLRGGRLENSSGHPDAGKVWAFGAHRQRLTDAVNFKSHGGDATTIRLTSATEARSFKVAAGERTELWLFSAALMAERAGDPTRLMHSELLFDYLVDAPPVLAECNEATGRSVPTTEIPFAHATSASNGIVAGAVFPPDTIFCYVADFLLDTLGVKK
jgi:hypothetical protein